MIFNRKWLNKKKKMSTDHSPPHISEMTFWLCADKEITAALFFIFILFDFAAAAAIAAQMHRYIDNKYLERILQVYLLLVLKQQSVNFTYSFRIYSIYRQHFYVVIYNKIRTGDRTRATVHISSIRIDEENWQCPPVNRWCFNRSNALTSHGTQIDICLRSKCVVLYI